MPKTKLKLPALEIYTDGVGVKMGLHYGRAFETVGGVRPYTVVLFPSSISDFERYREEYDAG
jgi:hypothetical protein